MTDRLETYRFDVYGNLRGSFETCEAAIAAIERRLGFVRYALAGMMGSDQIAEPALTLAPAHDELGRICEELDAVSTVLADLELLTA